MIRIFKFIEILILLGLLFFVIFKNINNRNHYSQKSNNYSQKITIVTTIFPLYDFTRNIVGDLANVSLLLPPGIEPHSFEPKPSDIVTIKKANIFIYTHPSMEPWAQDIIKGIDNNNILVVNAGKNVSLIEAEHEDEHHDDEHVDPHIWLDPIRVEQIINTITEAIIQKDNTKKEEYLIRAKTYKKKLSNLHNEYLSKLANCKNRDIVYGGHYAFGYLAKRYNLNYIAAQGFIPDSEPTAQDLISMINFIKEKDIHTIFYEKLDSPRIAKTLTQETGTNLLQLNTIGTISKSDMEKGVDYLYLMNVNLNNLKTGLMCDN